MKEVKKALRSWKSARRLADALGVTIATAGRYIAALQDELECKEVREGLRGIPSKAYRVKRG